jgi:hypothetical protein
MTKLYAFVLALLIVFAIGGSAANAAPPPRHAYPSTRVIVLRDVTGAVCFRGSIAALRVAMLRGTLCP